MDAGGENVLVSHYMTEMRGIGCKQCDGREECAQLKN